MLNKADRAKLAKKTINDFIPHLLKSDTRARKGVEGSELIRFSPINVNKKSSHSPRTSTDNLPEASGARPQVSQGSLHDFFPTIPKERKVDDNQQNINSSTSTPDASLAVPVPNPPRIRVIKSDTFDAAEATIKAHPGSSIAVLNMASALQPGGGVLRGALAQEEALCVRSTLYPSLKPNYYRMPVLSAVYTQDVLVFRGSDLVDLPKSEWFYTAVISCAALKGPDVKKVEDGKMVYAEDKDREIMTEKIRLIFQIANDKGIKHLILGALGCGAYHNPPTEVAQIFRKVLLGGRRKEGVTGIEEVTFAIFDEGENLRSFKEVFEDVIVD
ncbi:hypothetical protein ONS95_011004 [Cadophora gregata]|uniref:uncharacterized protein n=1 Tax=Cadophora gregata TaxID=51156 RepID=UPI0026DBCEEE|nr:uncharacterized protein ONS95_011004 [Cadophora gregata]KAK0119564.1 hypothetical protein ONS95_011004 [Cadophora gregata]KAK0120600.1 hypothetical protein ONS96_010804 [Cadophora gregata f. sp. sojae]